METYVVVVGIVKYKNKILILKRSPTKKYSPNLWEFISGFIKDGESAEDAVLRELREETKLKGKIVHSGKPFEVKDKWSRWFIIPFLIEVKADKIKMSREHLKYMWIEPKDIDHFKCVAGIKNDLKSVGLL